MKPTTEHDGDQERLSNYEEKDVAKITKEQADMDHAEKWKLAVQRAQRTATWAKTMTKQLISRSNGKQPRWHVVNFIGPKKAESRGIVDLLAIRKSHQDLAAPLKKGDLFEVVLLQVKGGGAKWPTVDDTERLRLVGEKYQAKAILLSEWKQGAKPKLYRLNENGDDWGKNNPIDPAVVFCPNGKPTTKKKPVKGTSGESIMRLSSHSNAARVTSAAPTPKGAAAKKAWATRKAAAAIGKQ